MGPRIPNLFFPIAAGAVFLALVAWPMGQIALRAGAAAWPPELGPIAAASVRQALASAAASFAIGVPLGWACARNWTPWIRGFLVAAFAMPALFAIGAVGIVLRGTEYRFGLVAVVAAHALLNAPWIALATAEGLRAVPGEWIAAARTLGASPARAFARVGLPVVVRAVGVATAQVFALCLMSFAVVLVLGGGPPVVTLETEIYASVRGAGLELGRAAVYAAVQFALAAAPLVLVVARNARSPGRDSLARDARKEGRPTGGAGGRFVVHAALAAWIAYPAVLFARGLDFARFAETFGDPELRAAAGTSLRIGVGAAASAVAAGLLFAAAARDSRIARGLAAIPAGLSPLLVSLGFFLAYSRFVDPFEGSELGMIAVQATLFLPYALRFFLPLAESERSGPRRDLRAAARTLGASAFTAWRRLEGPRWRAAAARFGALAFVWSFSELAAASFFGSENLRPLGVLLVRWLAQYRFDEVNAVLFVTYLLSAVVLVAVGRRAEGES